MARAFVLGNGSMLVNLDNEGQVRDYYFPYVGLENHTSGVPHKLGIWVDGIFCWLDASDWQKNYSYEEEALTTDITKINNKLKIKVHFNDIVDHKKNIFLRKATIENLSDQKREIRFFFHQAFTILESPYEDTVYYNPEIEALIHYKSRRYFLINTCFAGEKTTGIHNYTCDYAGYSAKDAEDGILSGNSTKHGHVDSALSINFELDSKSNKKLCYWICTGKNINQVKQLNGYCLHNHSKIVDTTKKESKKWVNRTPFEFRGLSTSIVKLFKQSLLIIKANTDQDGSIIASCDSDLIHDSGNSYSHVWPRDGSLITRALDRGGYIDLSKNFFNFCAKVLTSEGYLFHKYLPNKSRASHWASWFDQDGNIQLPIQEDETAIVLDALLNHYSLYKDKDFIESLYTKFIIKAGDFLLSYRDLDTKLTKQSYDLWEEKLGIHTYTCCNVYAGFRALAFFEELFGNVIKAKEYKKAAQELKDAILKYLYDEKGEYFIKGLYLKNGKFEKDMTNDISSFYGIFGFQVLDPEDPRVKSHFKSIQKYLYCDSPIGGYARYERDGYYQTKQKLPGNPWFITTLWVAEYYITKAQTQDDLKPAIEIFKWVERHALSTGILSEQLDPDTGEQLSAAPLTWSHAAFVSTIIKYLEKLDVLKICPICAPVVRENHF